MSLKTATLHIEKIPIEIEIENPDHAFLQHMLQSQGTGADSLPKEAQEKIEKLKNDTKIAFKWQGTLKVEISYPPPMTVSSQINNNNITLGGPNIDNNSNNSDNNSNHRLQNGNTDGHIHGPNCDHSHSHHGSSDSGDNDNQIITNNDKINENHNETKQNEENDDSNNDKNNENINENTKINKNNNNNNNKDTNLNATPEMGEKREYLLELLIRQD